MDANLTQGKEKARSIDTLGKDTEAPPRLECDLDTIFDESSYNNAESSQHAPKYGRRATGGIYKVDENSLVFIRGKEIKSDSGSGSGHGTISDKDETRINNSSRKLSKENIYTNLEASARLSSIDNGALPRPLSPSYKLRPEADFGIGPSNTVEVNEHRKEATDNISDRSRPRTLHSFFDLEDKNFAVQDFKVPPDYIPTPEDYHIFYWKCMTLKSELVRLDFALRSVGSSGPGIHAANIVKMRLQQLRDLYGTNTIVLFPDDANVKAYTPADSQVYLSRISRTFEDFAEGLDMMARALHDFNGAYYDENLMLLLFSLHSRFMTEAMKSSICYGVRHARGTEELKLHFQMLLKEWIEVAVESLTDAIKNFNDKGVETIRSVQHQKTSGYLDMTTIATFFSAVTATMIQFTIGNNDNPIGVATNTFMFSSLVFSIGSAVNSLLVTAWRRSFVREPGQAIPSWFSTWLNAGSMVSLVAAGAFFSIALCLLTFSSSQHLVTSIVIIGFSGLHAGGLILLSMFFLFEQWKFRSEAGPVGIGLTSDSPLLSLIDMAVNWLRALNHFRGKQMYDTHGGLGGNVEVQTTPSEKIEPFESLQTQALQNALSDETFLLGITYTRSPYLTPSMGGTMNSKNNYSPWRSRSTPRKPDEKAPLANVVYYSEAYTRAPPGPAPNIPDSNVLSLPALHDMHSVAMTPVSYSTDAQTFSSDADWEAIELEGSDAIPPLADHWEDEFGGDTEPSEISEQDLSQNISVGVGRIIIDSPGGSDVDVLAPSQPSLSDVRHEQSSPPLPPPRSHNSVVPDVPTRRRYEGIGTKPQLGSGILRAAFFLEPTLRWAPSRLKRGLTVSPLPAHLTGGRPFRPL